MMTRRLLITSVGSGVGQTILRALGRTEAPWHVIGVNSVALSAGNFDCDSIWLAPLVADREAFEARLLEVVEATGPALILPGRDDDLPVLAAMRDRLAALGAFVLVGSAEAVDICNDKYRTASVLRAAGLPFAKTAASREEIEALAASRGFPLFAKPKRGYGSRGVKVLFDRNDIEAAFGSGTEMVVQEFLVPRSWNKARAEVTRADTERGGILHQEDDFSAQVLLSRDGEALGVIVMRFSHVHDVTMNVEVLDNLTLEAVARECAELLGGRGLMGPCNIGGRLLADGAWQFFEVNARFTGSTAMRVAFGFNEVEAAWRHFVEGDERPNCLTFGKDLVACRYLTDTIVRQDDHERLRRWRRWHASS